MTKIEMLAEIEKRAKDGLGHYNPVAHIDCPHCEARLEAMDAKAHVLTDPAVK